MLNKKDIGVSKGLSLALYYPEFLLPVLCSSLAPDPHLAWLDGHFARGELEGIVCSPSVCSPFKSLDVSVELGSSNPTVYREVIASWWWDKLTFTWPLCCLFPRLPSPPNTEAKLGVCATLVELMQYLGMWLGMSTVLFKTRQCCPPEVRESGFLSANALFDGYLLPSCFSASERCCLQMQWGENNTSCRTDRVYSFYCYSYL